MTNKEHALQTALDVLTAVALGVGGATFLFFWLSA